jgi:hypothetical protein
MRSHIIFMIPSILSSTYDWGFGWDGNRNTINSKIRELCRDAAKHFSLASSCYQPYAAMRRSIFLWPHLATNLMPRCGEAFSFGFFLLRTFCRDAAKHFPFDSSCYQPFAAMRRSISKLLPPDISPLRGYEIFHFRFLQICRSSGPMNLLILPLQLLIQLLNFYFNYLLPLPCSLFIIQLEVPSVGEL